MTEKFEEKPRYSDEYIIQNGIPYEKYLAMPEDERSEKFPYGSITSSGITIAITFEHNQAIRENEAKMTADLMQQKGLKENHELREKFPNSQFKHICYDDAIVGVDTVTQSIIYDVMYYGYLAIMFIEWSCPK